MIDLGCSVYILKTFGLCICLLSSFSCAHKGPHGLEFFSGEGAPIRWKQSVGRKFGSLAVSTVVASNQIRSDGQLFSRFRNGAEILLEGISQPKSQTSGYLRVNRGFYTNTHSTTKNHERHIELFRGSPIISVFDRSTKAGLSYRFSLNAIYSHVTYFEK